MLNNRITFYEDYERDNKFFFQTSKQHYTDNTIQELELNNGRVIDQTANILQEQKKFYENLYTSKFQMATQSMTLNMKRNSSHNLRIFQGC